MKSLHNLYVVGIGSILYQFLGILYTLLFVEEPVVIIPESIHIMAWRHVSYGMVLCFLTALIGIVVLLSNARQFFISNNRLRYLVIFITCSTWILFTISFGFGKSPSVDLWNDYAFTVSYFGLYEVQPTYWVIANFFHNTIFNLFYTLSLMYLTGIIIRYKVIYKK